ncbi:MAG: hypothetical protein JKY54_00835 [Flavobacteriales bacterium]|nr:hypothetical protein [Flavobacteriales bacterium]
MIRFWFISLICCTSMFALAQNPGFLGKHIYGSLYGDFMPLKGALLFDGLENEEYSVNYSSSRDFNLRFGVELNFVLSKKIELGISYERMNNYLLLDDTKLIYDPIGNEMVLTYLKNLALMYGSTYGITIKRYRKNHIAPLGHYRYFQFLHNDISIYDNGNTNGPNQTLLGKIKSQSLLYGIGYQKVFFDKLLVHGTFSLGLNFQGVVFAIVDPQTTSDYTYAMHMAHRKMAVMHFMDFSFGVGYFIK